MFQIQTHIITPKHTHLLILEPTTHIYILCINKKKTNKASFSLLE